MKSATLADKFLQKAADDERLLPSHISLFMALFYYSPGKAGEQFRVSRRRLMRFSRIRSVATYHKCMRELVACGYVGYQPSFDPCRASSVALLG